METMGGENYKLSFAGGLLLKWFFLNPDTDQMMFLKNRNSPLHVDTRMPN